MPGYVPTPLTELPEFARELGVRRVLVKDESLRFDLPAFKILGVSWALSRVLAARAGDPGTPPSFDRLQESARQLAPLELVCATDGNHGRALARMATSLGLESCVHVPDSLNPAAIDAIEREGATVVQSPGGYDVAVVRAAEHASSGANRLLIQDTAWPRYEEIPGWIVEGYSTLFHEIDEQVDGAAVNLIVVPTGVGSLLQAAVAHSRRDGIASPPAVVAVEPDRAACIQASLQAGHLTTIETSHTVMAGLNCGTGSALAWPVIANGLDAAVAVSDDHALAAMADLRAAGIDAGPCGAASLAGARTALTGPGANLRRTHLGISADSVVVLVSTDGRASGAG